MKRLFWIVIFFSFLVKLSLIFYLYPAREKMFNGDSELYEGLAVSMLEHNTYQYLPLGSTSDLIRPPGFPFYIYIQYLLFGVSFLFPILMNVLCFGLLLWTTNELAKLVGIKNNYLLLMVLLLDLGWTLHTAQLVSEPVFTPLFLLSIICLINFINSKKLYYLLSSAILLGVCSLIKPITFYLPIFIVIFLFVKRQYVPATLYLLISFIMVFPWMVRNKIVHDTYTFTSIQNDNLALAHCSYIYSEVNQVTFLQAQDSLDKIISKELVIHGNSDFKYANAIKGKFALQYIGNHPFIYAKSIIKGMMVTLVDPGRITLNLIFPKEDITQMGFNNYISKDGLIGSFKMLLQKDQNTVLILVTYMIFLGIVTVIAFFGISLFYQKNSELFILISMVTMYLLVLGGPNGNARFRLYILPFILIYFQFGIDKINTWWKQKYFSPKTLINSNKVD